MAKPTKPATMEDVDEQMLLDVMFSNPVVLLKVLSDTVLKIAVRCFLPSRSQKKTL